MHHPFPKPFKGNFPFAVLHAARTGGFPEGVTMALRLAKDPDMTVDDAEMYTAMCLGSKGHPQVIDLIEGGRDD